MLFIDFETRSSVPLKTHGVYNYVNSHDSNIICLVCSDSENGNPVRWVPNDPIPALILKSANEGVLFAASNAAFDRIIYNEIAVKKYGFPSLALDRWYCTQAESRVSGLPSKLKSLGEALGLQIQKSSRGAALISKMCVPIFESSQALLDEMLAYCECDVIVSMLASAKLPKLTDKLRDDYVINERINDRGFFIDQELSHAAIGYLAQEQQEYASKLSELTNGAVQKHTQSRRFALWIEKKLSNHEAKKLLYVDSESKKLSIGKPIRASIIENSESMDIPYSVIEAINCYDDASGTATAKFAKLLSQCCSDGRVRGVFRAFGAPRTLRYTSTGVQVHNMYREVFPETQIPTMRSAIINKTPLFDPQTKKPIAVTTALSRLLRSTIIAAPGHVFVSADWSSIESRMTAWLAKDTDKIDMFIAGECPYCYEATKIYGRKINKVDDPEERQIGKIVDLACGFLGGVGALQSMSRNFNVKLSEYDCQKLVDSWRSKHTKIIELGDSLVKAAIRAVQHANIPQKVSCGVTYFFDGINLTVTLPDTETKLTYPQARLSRNPKWGSLEITALKASVQKKQTDVEWPRHALWRGLLLENIVQAACAVLLRDLIAAFQHVCVLHMHDEIVLEVLIKHSTAYKEELDRIMRLSPSWAIGLPLSAVSKISCRFGK